MKLLVVEDDRKVAGFIHHGLKEEGYTADIAPDGEQATLLALVNTYDLILLDVMLPKKDGFQVLAELRAEGRTTPVLMLTSRGSVEDIVRGLDAGADDYLAKPFPFDELLARIRALARRGSRPAEVLRAGPLELDRLKQRAQVEGTLLDLTAKQFQLLEYFMLHPNKVLPRAELLEKVWEMPFDPETNLVNVHVGNLRRKLAKMTSNPRIQTVRGSGFMFQVVDGPTPPPTP